MKKLSNFQVGYEFFSGRREEGIVLISFKENLLQRSTHLDAKGKLFDYLELGLVPKGGGAYFLSRLLGFSKAWEVLLSDEDITAEEALELGIVDKVVPSVELNEAALKIAKDFARKPVGSVSGIKKLLSCCRKELGDCLECENQLLLQTVSRSDFRKSLGEYTEAYHL